MQETLDSDLNYIEMKISEFKRQLEVPFFDRRSEKHKKDAVDELKEVYAEMRYREKAYGKVFDITQFLLEKNKEL